MPKPKPDPLPRGLRLDAVFGPRAAAGRTGQPQSSPPLRPLQVVVELPLSGPTKARHAVEAAGEVASELRAVRVRSVTVSSWSLCDPVN